MAAIADQLATACTMPASASPRRRSAANGDWVLIDAGDVIIHIFRPEIREFYNIEKMWAARNSRTARYIESQVRRTFEPSHRTVSPSCMLGMWLSSPKRRIAAEMIVDDRIVACSAARLA